MAKRKKRTGHHATHKNISSAEPETKQAQTPRATRNHKEQRTNAYKPEASGETTTWYRFLYVASVHVLYWLSKRFSSIIPKVLLNRQDLDFHESDYFEEDGPGNIPVDLISGKMPAVKRTESGWGLEYVSLVRGPGDRMKPELIRVLIVHPDTEDQPLECSIEVALLPSPNNYRDSKEEDAEDKIVKHYRSLGQVYNYTALSYSWEGQLPTETIYIRDSASERKLTFQVTKNLKEALTQLRDIRENRIFWADAVCMNQNDKSEKNQQLPLMPRIYGEAKNVCVWLGSEDSATGACKAFGLIKKIRKWENYKRVVEDETTCEEWDAFIALMNRNWFRRRWIVQEIVLAGADYAEIWWGSEHIPWTEFAQAVALFEGGLKTRVKDKFRANGKYEHHPDMYGEVEEFNATRLVKVTADIVSRRDDGGVVKKRESLESLISTLTPFDTGQAHDIVYAVLSLAKDVSAGSPTVSIKTELELDDLPKNMRLGCELHSPRPESTKLWIPFLLAGAVAIAAFAVWIRKNYVLSLLWYDLGPLLFVFGHPGINFWVLGLALIVFAIKIVESIIKKLYRWSLGISLVGSAIKIVTFVIRKIHEWQTRKGRGLRRKPVQSKDGSIDQTVQCECRRKLRILNNVMRRLRHEKFPVDYGKGFDAVCDDLYTFTSHQSMSLDLIFRPWCPEPPTWKILPNGSKKWLPTWVRGLAYKAFKPDLKGHIQRVNADTLVGKPGTSPYQASGRYRSGWRFERDGEAQILSARGFQLDIIDKIAEPAESGIIPKKWLKEYKRPLGGEFSRPRSGGDQDHQNTVSMQFWRTMIAGKGRNGQNPPLSYSLVCQELFHSEDGINLISIRDRSTNEVLKEFIDRILSVIWGRKLARTSRLERLALLPYETEKDDVICILYGCSVPAVLRKIEEKTSKGEDMWELIGECYVYEMMAGEALVEKRKRLNNDLEFYREREFKIR